jgi:hypothetical protein
MAADPLAHVGQGYHRFRRYAPRMLRTLGIQAAGGCLSLSAGRPLLEAPSTSSWSNAAMQPPCPREPAYVAPWLRVLHDQQRLRYSRRANLLGSRLDHQHGHLCEVQREAVCGDVGMWGCGNK